MTGPKKPEKPEIRIVAEAVISKPSSKVDETREDTKATLTAPQLPTQYVDRIEEADMVDTNGVDRKEEALQFCENANAFLARISSISELSESAQAIKDKLRTLTGESLYEQIGAILEELDTMAAELIKEGTDPAHGAQYLENTADGPGTPRVDIEGIMLRYEVLRPLHKQIASEHISDYVTTHERSISKDMGEKDVTQLVLRYMRQKALERKIDAALEKGEIDEKTATEILKASTGQMNMAFNPFGQLRGAIMDHDYENVLGENEAEKRFLILDLYSQFLAVTEGFRYLQRFYK